MLFRSRALRAQMNPGALLVISTPNRRSLPGARRWAAEHGVPGIKLSLAPIDNWQTWVDLESHAAAVTTLQAEVLDLVRRWKEAHATTAPEFAAARPVVHADHIGASTFIEKGWSRLSLGDHEGAAQALRQALEADGVALRPFATL